MRTFTNSFWVAGDGNRQRIKKEILSATDVNVLREFLFLRETGKAIPVVNGGFGKPVALGMPILIITRETPSNAHLQGPQLEFGFDP